MYNLRKSEKRRNSKKARAKRPRSPKASKKMVEELKKSGVFTVGDVDEVSGSTAESIIKLQTKTIDLITHDASLSGFTPNVMNNINALAALLNAAKQSIIDAAKSAGFEPIQHDRRMAFKRDGVKISIGRGYSDGTSILALLLDESNNLLFDSEYCADTFEKLVEILPPYGEYLKILNNRPQSMN